MTCRSVVPRIDGRNVAPHPDSRHPSCMKPGRPSIEADLRETPASASSALIVGDATIEHTAKQTLGLAAAATSGTPCQHESLRPRDLSRIEGLSTMLNVSWSDRREPGLHSWPCRCPCPWSTPAVSIDCYIDTLRLSPAPDVGARFSGLSEGVRIQRGLETAGKGSAPLPASLPDAVTAAVATQNQLAVLNESIQALERLPEDDGTIRLFDFHTSTAMSGNFQIGAVQRGNNGVPSLALGAFHFRSRDARRRFLFFAWGRNRSTSGRRQRN